MGQNDTVALSRAFKKKQVEDHYRSQHAKDTNGEDNGFFWREERTNNIATYK